MGEKLRYNKIIDLLEHGKPVFSTSTVPNGSLDDLTYIADADYDAVIIEMEHEGFSFTTLRDATYHRIISYPKSNQLLRRSPTGNPAR